MGCIKAKHSKKKKKKKAENTDKKDAQTHKRKLRVTFCECLWCDNVRTHRAYIVHMRMFTYTSHVPMHSAHTGL